MKLPSAVGSKLTVIVTAWPASSTVPFAGTPVAPNGAVGSCTPLIVSDAPPTLRKVAVADRWPPTLVPPKDRTAGVDCSCAAADWPVPESEKLAVPWSVSAVSVPPTRPDWLGTKVTGTCA